MLTTDEKKSKTGWSSGVWLRSAGIDKLRFSFHGLQHTFATNLLVKTGNIKAVQEAIDHSNVRTTQIYAHMLPETVRQAVRCSTGR